MGAASTPIFAKADIASFFNSFFISSTPISKAASLGLNSQTMALLEPSVSIDPNPSSGGGNISIVDGTALETEAGPAGIGTELHETHSTKISVYTVHAGDTLSEIAEMFDVSVKTIMWANDIKNGRISPGQVLIILPITGIRHTVVKGETLSSIAKKYKGDVDEITQYNDLRVGQELAVGDTVIIPDGEIPASPAPSTASGRTSPLHGAGGPNLNSYFTWPADGGIVTQDLHGYNGVDIGAPTGTSVFASAGGSVIVARDSGWNGGYGAYVVIQHPNGTQTLYAHLSAVTVSMGDTVAMGQNIGRIGSTGKATGPHLHFEVRGATNPFRR